jgi:hypothetical protein
MVIFPIIMQKKNLTIKEGGTFPFHFTPLKRTGPPFLYQKDHKNRGK